MKILVVADEESPYLWDYYQPGRLKGIDMIISCGDLDRHYLEFLVTMANVPLLYVPGNHDKSYIPRPPEGCECIDDRLVECKGLRIMGLGGCIRYNHGIYQYTDREMARRINRLVPHLALAGGVDIIVTHAPPRGYGDQEDFAHRGFKAFVPLMAHYHPMYLFHGHVHPRYGFQIPRFVKYGNTSIFNSVGWHIVEIEPPIRSKAAQLRFKLFSSHPDEPEEDKYMDSVKIINRF